MAPGTTSAARSLVSPEMQIAHETSAAGYVNYMRDNVSAGVGQTNGTVNGVVLNRRDIQPDFTAELAVATDAATLVDQVLGKLTYGNTSTALRTEIVNAVGLISLPVLTPTNQAAVDAAKRTRVNAAVLLVLASPEFAVQK